MPHAISKHKKKLILYGDGLCFICRLPLNEDITLEHIVPKYFWHPQNGSPNAMKNLALSHKKCNKSRFKEYFKHRSDAIGYIVKVWVKARRQHSLDCSSNTFYKLFKTKFMGNIS